MPVERGYLYTRVLECNPICDICGKARSHGKHVKCSKIRQKRYVDDWKKAKTNEDPLPVPELSGAQEAE